MEKQRILVYLECADGQIQKSSLEALSAANVLAEKVGEDVTAVVIGVYNAIEQARSYGVKEVIYIDSKNTQAASYAAILAELYKEYDSRYMLLGASRDGKEVAAAVAEICEVGCVNDACELNEMGWVRSVFGGSLQEVINLGKKGIISIRPGTFGKPEQVQGNSMVQISHAFTEPVLRTIVRDVVNEISADVNLEDAEVIVAGGRGMGNAENFQMVYQLAELLGGVVGASRPAIEEGWVHRNHQIGQSGKIVAPKLYIACGISGAMQHVSGVTGAGFIVAINKDEDAPIFDVADVGIVGNVTEILPLLIEEIKARKA